MAKDSSFDVVSEVNMQEVDNAFQQTTREDVYKRQVQGSPFCLRPGGPHMKFPALQSCARRKAH